MKQFTIFLTLSDKENEPNEQSNRETLEEIYDLDLGEAFKSEISYFIEDKNMLPPDRREDAKAFDLFMHDMVDKNSPLYSILSAKYNLDKKEYWIKFCEGIINKFKVNEEIVDNYLLDVYTAEGFYFRFKLPKDVPPTVFNAADVECFTNPALAAPQQFRLIELKEMNIVKYALVPFYRRLAMFSKDPEDPKVRDISKYFVGLA